MGILFSQKPDSTASANAVCESMMKIEESKGQYFSELVSVLKMSKLYFSKKTRAEIDALMKDLAAEEENRENLLDSNFNRRANRIINTMTLELDVEYNPQGALPAGFSKK